MEKALHLTRKQIQSMCLLNYCSKINFCLHYFGEYMHHLPNIFDNMLRPRAVAKLEIEKLLPYIYDNPGENTV